MMENMVKHEHFVVESHKVHQWYRKTRLARITCNQLNRNSVLRERERERKKTSNQLN